MVHEYLYLRNLPHEYIEWQVQLEANRHPRQETSILFQHCSSPLADALTRESSVPFCYSSRHEIFAFLSGMHYTVPLHHTDECVSRASKQLKIDKPWF